LPAEPPQGLQGTEELLLLRFLIVGGAWVVRASHRRIVTSRCGIEPAGLVVFPRQVLLAHGDAAHLLAGEAQQFIAGEAVARTRTRKAGSSCIRARNCLS
jgi:hypothetical protein